MLRTDDLQFQGLQIIQDGNGACFSEDAVLLSDFLRLTPRDSAVDLGAGNGIISILGAAKTGARFTGVECDAAQCALARRSAELNKQEITFCCMDVADAPGALGRGVFSAAVMNPPYFVCGDPADNPARALARHAAAETLDRFLGAAFQLLNNGGRLFLSYPAAQLTDLICSLRKNRLEPKRLRPALPDASGVPQRVLVEAKKLGKPGLVWERLVIRAD